MSDADLAITQDGRRRTHRLTERSGELACTQFRRFPLILRLFQSILQNLPAEILALIFEDPVTSEVTAALARAIRPFTRANIYRKLDITYPKFMKLCELIQGSLDLAGLVIELCLSQCYGHRDSDEGPIFDFFRSATSLRILEIPSSIYLPARLLSAKFATVCYSSLTQLKFSSYKNSAETLSYQFRNLDFVPRLERLSIGWDDGLEAFDEDAADELALHWEEESTALVGAGFLRKRARPIVYCVLTWSEYRNSGLEAQVVEPASERDLDQSGIVNFVSRFPQLEELSLCVDLEDGHVNLREVISAVTPNLRQLHVDVPEYLVEDSDPGTLLIQHRLDPNLLPKLERLRVLSEDSDPNLPLTLSKFTKLHSLEFRYVPSYSSLRQLLTGPTKIPNLRRLVIHAPTEYTRGLSHEHDYYRAEDHFNHVSGELEIDEDWKPPDWGDMDCFDARDILDLAKAGGVQIPTNWERIVEVSEEYEAELAWCEQFRAENLRRLY